MATAAETKVTHTPGPWNWKPYSRFGALDGAEISTVAEVDHTPKLRGPTYIGVLNDVKNAALIAAAPEMFEALELEQFVEELKATHDPRDIIRLLESRGDYESGHMDPLGVIDHYQTKAALARETVLAKARGEA